jgi:hypothetical protein
MEWDAECIQIANRAGSMCWLHEEANGKKNLMGTVGARAAEIIPVSSHFFVFIIYIINTH